jgi:hypothetical protein
MVDTVSKPLSLLIERTHETQPAAHSAHGVRARGWVDAVRVHGCEVEMLCGNAMACALVKGRS